MAAYACMGCLATRKEVGSGLSQRPSAGERAARVLRPLCVQSMGVLRNLGHQGDKEGEVGLQVPRAEKESRG
jgi:hypothetical protein